MANSRDDAGRPPSALSKINRDLEEKAAQERARTLKMPYVNIGVFPINPDVLHVLPEEDARKANVLPFFKVGKSLKLAVTDPKNTETQAVLGLLQAKGFTVELHLASAGGILEATLSAYGSPQYKLKTQIANVVKETEIQYEKELKNLADLAGRLAELPAEEALNMLHVSAIKAVASDIHYQPEETGCLVRFRIDGVLHSVFTLAREVYVRLATQLKYKANMKLNVTALPQDGRFRFRVNDRFVDVRVSSLPTSRGEALVCRILDSAKKFQSFEELGFAEPALAVLERACGLAQGMVLVTGPTSSGKTTTLYVLLSKFNMPERKIITLEDPVEYELAGISQSPIDEKHGYSFADGLRTVLRQDPNVIMIGEIRDRETAEVSAQAALTGHVVLSTLHTNSAVETIPRLLTMGVAPFVAAPALALIAAQRLVRRLCACAASRALKATEKDFFERALHAIAAIRGEYATAIPATLNVPKGCDLCSGTGFRGQMVLAEAFEVSADLREAILKGASAGELRALVQKAGMLTMEQDAVLKVCRGFTTLEEVHRVIHT